MGVTLTASTAHRWSRCPGSVHACAVSDRAPTETDSMREGTAASWVAECVLAGDAGSTDDLVGRVHKNGVEIAPEMAGHVQGYVDFVRSHVTGKDDSMLIEHDADWMNVKARPDAVIIGSDTLQVFDLKYGHRVVEAYDNRQILCGAAAIVQEYGIAPVMVSMWIYQPRALHADGIARQWTMTGDEFTAAIGNLNSLRDAASHGTRTMTPGAHCRGCLVAADCEALTHTAYALADTVTSVDMLDVPDHRLGMELDFLTDAERILSARIDAVKADVRARIETGRTVPGWAVQTGFGQRAFKFGPETIQMLTGIDPWAERKPATPAEMERRGADKAAIADMTYRPEKAPTLKRVSEKDIARIFGNDQV